MLGIVLLFSSAVFNPNFMNFSYEILRPIQVQSTYFVIYTNGYFQGGHIAKLNTIWIVILKYAKITKNTSYSQLLLK